MSVIPILITVSLLYGFIEIAGYSINIVTATIGAVSIGFGIDYAIHLTMRFREEMERGGTRNDAMEANRGGNGHCAAFVGSFKCGRILHSRLWPDAALCELGIAHGGDDHHGSRSDAARTAQPSHDRDKGTRNGLIRNVP